MPLPFLLLFIMLIQGLTLDGAWKGIKEYFDFSNWDELGSTGIWNAAIGQCFFSLSICMGVMTAYGSYNPTTQDIATDEKVIAFLDVSASLMSGFVVYSILGYLVVSTGDESWFEQASFGLVFAAFPVAIATFKGATFFGIIFYLTLVMLGIDSAFSMVEAVSTVIDDSDLNRYRLQWSRTKISALICVVGAFCSSLYCFDTGLYWLDVVDRYINNYGMVFLGICETGATGWFYRYDLIEEQIGVVSASLYRLGYWFSVFMACILSFSLATPVEICSEGDCSYVFTGTMGNDSWIVGFVTGIILWIITIILAYVQRSDHAKHNLSTAQTFWYLMGWENVEVLRDFMNGNGLGQEAWKNARHTTRGEGYALVHHSTIGIWWGFLIKYWLPTVLTVNLIGTMREDRWNPYGDYPAVYLVVGVIIFVSMIFVVVLIAIFPQWMTQSVDDSNVYGNMDKQAVADQSNMAYSGRNEGGTDTEKVELVSAEKPKKEANQNDVEEEEEAQPPPDYVNVEQEDKDKAAEPEEQAPKEDDKQEDKDKGYAD